MRSTTGQRTLDVCGSLVGLTVLAVPMAIIWARIRSTMGSPAVFSQPRTGLYGRVFRICKFRTMTDVRGPDGRLLPDTERLTSLGRSLRRTSLDELPELINVLKGEMSLVGPRPLLPEYLGRYTPEQARRHEVKPGITGWAQINGRNALTWEEKFALDVWYVDHRSLGLDLKILGRTLAQVVRGAGVSAHGHATMPPFTGEQPNGTTS
jgi:lipopolysaccharide/colanic/teichoic acid biosynthesis glycosyltransferase